MKSPLPFMALCLSLSVIWSPFSLANQTSEQKTEKSTDQSTKKSAYHIPEESTEQIQITEKVPIILYINRRPYASSRVNRSGDISRAINIYFAKLRGWEQEVPSLAVRFWQRLTRRSL